MVPQAVSACTPSAFELQLLSQAEFSFRQMAQPLLLSGIGHAGLPLYTNEQLAVSASIKAGLEPEKELVWRRQYTSFIIDCGKELQV